MLVNPFTPSEIASQPQDFFGRREELNLVERSLNQGSVAIDGSIGIGKSSLLARIRLIMEGFDSSHKSKSVIAVGDRNIETIDEAARLLLERFIKIDEKQNKFSIKLGSFFEYESSEIVHYFKEGRHLSILKKIVEDEYLSKILNDGEFLILAIDEADKCPIPLARLIRSISTHTQQEGVKGIRFLLAGVTPFFTEMVKEDKGITRFFYKTITLQPMPIEDAENLLETKLKIVQLEANKLGFDIKIEPLLLKHVAELSGGHPHLLQLLGSHLVENEDANPDGKIDRNDLINSLRKICYEDRVSVYENTVHELDLHGKLDNLNKILSKMKLSFPSRISRQTVRNLIDIEEIRWLTEHNILSMPTPYHYGMVDEFLRVKLMLDEAQTETEIKAKEHRIIYTEDGYDITSEE